MKVKFKYGIKSYSGTLDDLVYANYKKCNMVIGRRLVEREDTDQNRIIGNGGVKISSIYKLLREEYKQDLAKYAKRRGELESSQGKLVANRFMVFVKLCYAACQGMNHSSDVASLSLDDFSISVGLMNVKSAIEAGYLEEIDSYDDLIEMAV
jgi:hypothetical protein